MRIAKLQGIAVVLSLLLLGAGCSSEKGSKEDAGADLEELRKLTNGFLPPPEACNTYRALFAGLAEMESDLHRHIHLENAVLFPVALALSEKHG